MHGIKIAPSIPKEWKELEIDKEFRGRKLHIVVHNPDGRESGCGRLLVNGKPMEGNEIPESLLTERTEIELTL